jgi:hypothetical protein
MAKSKDERTDPVGTTTRSALASNPLAPVVIDPDGTVTVVSPSNGKDFKLQELYTHVGCDTVEMVPLPDGRIMWVDENGIRNAKPYNEAATKLVAKWLGSGDFIKGRALVCPAKMVK